MMNPSQNPIISGILVYIVVAFVIIFVGQLSAVRWVQVIGGGMLALLMTVVLGAAAYIAYDSSRNRGNRRNE